MFWILWGIGWLFVIGTRILLNIVNADYHGEYEYNYLDKKPRGVKSLIFALMGICIVLVGGIANGLWLGSLVKSEKGLWLNVGVALFFGAIPALLTYIVGFFVLGLYHIESELIHGVFIFIFITSIVCWTIPIMKYNENIHIKEQTSISSTTEYDLYYFCNIPVQEVSGYVDGKPSIIGSGQITGEISTTDKLPYWYDNGNGEGLYNSVDANEAKIKFIEDGQKPYVKITTYYNQKVKVNDNNGKTSVLEEWWTTVYEFYLPKEVMQYNIG